MQVPIRPTLADGLAVGRVGDLSFALAAPLVDQVVTVMNPGGAGKARFDLPPSVGILELEPGIPPRGRLVALSRES